MQGIPQEDDFRRIMRDIHPERNYPRNTDGMSASLERGSRWNGDASVAPSVGGTNRYYRGDSSVAPGESSRYPRGDSSVAPSIGGSNRYPRGDYPRGDYPRGDYPRGDYPRGDSSVAPGGSYQPYRGDASVAQGIGGSNRYPRGDASVAQSIGGSNRYPRGDPFPSGVSNRYKGDASVAPSVAPRYRGDASVAPSVTPKYDVLPSDRSVSTFGDRGDYPGYDGYDNDVEAMSRAVDQQSMDPSRPSSLFLHKLDPTYKNQIHKHQQKKQELIQTALKLSYILLALITCFGFGCMLVSQKLVSYSNLGSVVSKTTEANAGQLSSPGDNILQQRVNDLGNVLKAVSALEIEKPGTPQNKALMWLSRDDPLKLPVPQTGEAKRKLVQRYVLATLYFATDGENWTNQYNFLSGKNECEWNEPSGGYFNGAGGCTAKNPYVSMIALWNNNLQGGIPPELIHLPDLGVLSLYNNKLSGEVPNDFKHLPKMSTLYLHSNSLNGDLDFLCQKKIKDMRADCSDPNPMINCPCCEVCCGSDGNCYKT